MKQCNIVCYSIVTISSGKDRRQSSSNRPQPLEVVAEHFHPVKVSTSKHRNSHNHPAHFRPVPVDADPDPHTLLVSRQPMGRLRLHSDLGPFLSRQVGVRHHRRWLQVGIHRHTTTICWQMCYPLTKTNVWYQTMTFRTSSKNGQSVKSKRKMPTMGSCCHFFLTQGH